MDKKELVMKKVTYNTKDTQKAWGFFNLQVSVTARFFFIEI